jgi:hypothetical protein
MINLRLSTGQNLIVLCADDMPAFKNGTPIVTPDRAVMLIWSRDIDWLNQQIQKQILIGDLTREWLKDLMDRADQRDQQLAKNSATLPEPKKESVN